MKVANAVVWILLGAAESGEIQAEPLERRVEGPAQATEISPGAETLRCVRFLASLLRKQSGGAEVLAGVGKAVELNLQVNYGIHLPRGAALIAGWLA